MCVYICIYIYIYIFLWTFVCFVEGEECDFSILGRLMRHESVTRMNETHASLIHMTPTSLIYTTLATSKYMPHVSFIYAGCEWLSVSGCVRGYVYQVVCVCMYPHAQPCISVQQPYV